MKVLVKDVLTPAVLMDAAVNSRLGPSAAKAFAEKEIEIEILFNVNGEGDGNIQKINGHPVLNVFS